MRSSSFIELWDAGAESFAVDPPNAVLSFLDGDDTPDDVVVVLHDPRLEGNELTYRSTCSRGRCPTSTGPCTLFIDSFGRSVVAGLGSTSAADNAGT